MRIERCAPSEMKRILKEGLARNEKAPLFVFPSNVALDSWVAWLVRHPEESGVQALALESFTAWDRFKGSFLDARLPDRTAIPSLLRKLFVRDLIHRNNTQGQIFAKIIPRDEQDSPLSYAFTDWLAKILPSLALWHEKYTAAAGTGAAAPRDAEDADYLHLYESYKAFLDDHAFFEPAWERPSFTGNDRDVVIFYPELLEDFADYEVIFAQAQNVIAVRLPEEDLPKPPVYKFSDSRKELRRLILHLRELHEKKGVPWTDIALSVPDIETYAPYIRREFAAYCVPCSLRAGAPLTQNSAGLLFSQMSSCCAEDFSYDSVRALLQNEYVPWKPEYVEKKETLVRRGNEYRCLCSYQEGGRLVDSWEESLSAASDWDTLSFYRMFRKDVSEICRAQSFAGIRTAWMMFRERYLDAGAFTGGADRILGRCIAELDDLIEIEETYIKPLGLSAGPLFSFFLSELEGKIYKQQESVDGVSVFPYKLAAAAQFPYHFVIDASQRNLDIEYKRLSFLNTQKRRMLLADDGTDALDSNVSKAFIALYAKDAPEGEVQFSFAENSFQGFAIAHTALAVQVPAGQESDEQAEGYADLDAGDFIRNETTDMLALHAGEGRRFSPAMQRSFFAWKRKTAPCAGAGTGGSARAQECLRGRVEFLLKQSRNLAAYALSEEHAGDWKVTQTDLGSFYTCPRQWLFGKVLCIREVSLDTELMQRYDMGNIHHRILELFFNTCIKSGQPLPVTDADSGRFADETEAQVREQISAFAQQAVHDASRGLSQSHLAQVMLRSQSPLIAQTVMDFLHKLCLAPQKPSPDKLSSRTSIAGFGGFFVKGAELNLSAPAQTDGIRYVGKVDCLLYEKGRPERYALIDFKNTKSSMPGAAASWPDDEGLLGDFQMPLYAALVESTLCAQGGGQIEAAYFYAIKDRERTLVVDAYRGKAKNSDAETDTPKDASQFAARAGKALESYTADFAARMEAGNYDAASDAAGTSCVDVKPYVQCVSCSYRSICRTTCTVGKRTLIEARKTK